ncbi:hypothetical protein J1G44_06070 [Cellulomonas sp. zg-ZUI199]|uniref:Uncharacterized protein n=1 Tax=Cellulomonas wangleii TaxID=2816956 RepID=A0ABX8D4U2_9CELL|nr:MULTISPECIES: hypothetical protein [Cellulomonas]MBO0898950.1 hypothetical protein [Cellulomonas sp. zg-ZUI22]MBO0923763.1 hypothetical protein [Cellulomonas wangleii]MBO0924045.1 hypothetical protein [Cellulomonas wangleii]QVI62071.1 hypothetical protein KG103_16920 [Cellulomonas wangleii]
MKSAFLVSAAESFEDDVWRAARSLGGDVSEASTRVQDEQGRVLLITGGLGLDGAGAWQDDLVSSPGLDALPDLSTAAAVLVECRWEDLFASWIARLAALLPGAAWVVDDDGVVWPATRVDPEGVRL